MKKATNKLYPEQNLRFAVLAADIALFAWKEGKLWVRLMTVERPPFFNNIPGLPGGLVQPEETAEEAATRIIEAKAKVKVKNVHLEQLGTFSRVDRDPRGRVVAVAYLALTAWPKLDEAGQKSDAKLYWQPVKNIGKLAYDHDEILREAIKRLRSKISYTSMIKFLLPSQFTLSELEQAYAAILAKPLDKRNFRKKIIKLKLLKELPGLKTGGKHRPAKLYSFKTAKVEEIEML